MGEQRCGRPAGEIDRRRDVGRAVNNQRGHVDHVYAHPPGRPGTRLTLTHEGFNLDTPLGRQAYEGMKPGWPGLLERMDKVLGGA